MPAIYIIEGPVGSGKSTFCYELSNKVRAPHFNLDAWMVRLFRPDRPNTGVFEWYSERKQRCILQIWDIAKKTLESGCSVILELGLIRSEDRINFYQMAQGTGHPLEIFVLDVSRNIRRERVRKRNVEQGPSFSMEVPDHIFELASDMWEAPSEKEEDQFGIKFLTPRDK